MVKKEFIKVKLDDIIPYENNPRFNDIAVDDVVASIEQTENLDPIEIDENNVILSGHTRLKALYQLGYKETEVLQYTGLSEEKKKKYRLLANKVAEKSEWDFEKLEQELSELDFDDYDFGFDIENDITDDEPPAGFKEFDEDTETKNVCPRCGYEWN